MLCLDVFFNKGSPPRFLARLPRRNTHALICETVYSWEDEDDGEEKRSFSEHLLCVRLSAGGSRAPSLPRVANNPSRHTGETEAQYQHNWLKVNVQLGLELMPPSRKSQYLSWAVSHPSPYPPGLLYFQTKRPACPQKPTHSRRDLKSPSVIYCVHQLAAVSSIIHSLRL